MAAALLPFVVLTPLVLNQGGYFPTSWGWASLALLWAAGVAIVVRTRLELEVLDLLLLAAFVALGTWIALSAAWSTDRSQSVLEAQRVVVYVAAALALLAVVRRETVAHALGGVLAAITAASTYALATRLFPDRLGVFDPVAGYRLSEPVGYWNGLALLAAIGVLVALGFAAHAPTPARIAAAAATPVLVLTLYFTFSRGGWMSLGIGLGAATVLDRRRLRLVTTALVLGAFSSVAVVVASRSEALTDAAAAGLDAAAREGHRLAAVAVALAALAASSVAALVVAERRVRVARSIRAAYAVALVVVALAGVTGVLVRAGGPAAVAERAYDAFAGPPPPLGGDLNRRLFSFSGSWRAELWRAAWDDWENHPWTGSGAGTYERFWLQHRPIELKVRDAHSLYAETLAELGPVGVVLVVALVAVPLGAAIRRRDNALVPVSAGAFVAFAAHAGIDWDWEIPAVTLAGLACGALVVIAARRRDLGFARATRPTLLLLILPLAALAVTGLIGANALASSVDAREDRDWTGADDQARLAAAWMPWSPEPWAALAEARLARGDVVGARAAFGKAARADERDWKVWYDLARVTSGGARRRALARARSLNPRSRDVFDLRTRAGGADR